MDTPNLDYNTGRLLIKNGDLLSFKPRKNHTKLIQRLTQLVTRSSYYHSGIAVWLKSENVIARLFVCEAHKSGRRIVPLSVYSSHEFAVTECPVNFNLIERELVERVGFVPYGTIDYIVIGLRMLFGITAKNKSGQEVCSEMIQMLYRSVGLDLPKYALAPGELKEMVNSLGYNDRVYISN